MRKKKLRSVQAGDYVTVAGYRGIAFYVHGPELSRVDDDEIDDFDELIETGNLVVVMVGDDRKHVVDPDDVTLIDEDRFCRGCGQIGCGEVRS